MGKLLLLDIDGTLLNTKKELPVSAFEALQQARANGHELAIATGRAPFMFTDLRDELDIQTFISFNGQYIVRDKKVIHTEALNPEMLEKVFHFAERRDHPLVFMNGKKMISSIDYHPDIDESLKSLKFPHPDTEVDFHLDNDIYQSLVFCTKEEEAQYHENFRDFDFVRWHRVSCDILPKGGSKASGIERLIASTGHAVEETIAFGDGLNDLQMMQAAGYSVAMENGHPETKKVASYVTSHVDDDGLAKAFAHLGII
ncbi:Cof-type HAD-IIB family hydrolase [Planococcus salinarum]|uniref:Cof-type HAD-IIB family hydrolase n=1 Tax=Planococcus salinarum TaxID=622695 RepID=UPI000E3C1342|nr:Cof-type HAD-IIB family hydrolase [Planococcus salinarum]TAA72132.1 Cof-type HAD-IIB family hydrolase [Planococcus salinarum]